MTTMTTETNDVAELAGALAGDSKAERSVKAEIAKSALVTTLLEARLAKKLTQEKVAASMRCDPSKVSRIESGNDFDLRLGDIIRYACALGLTVSVSFDDPSLPAAVRIKRSVFEIHSALEALAALAREAGANDEITGKIRQFYGEVLINFLVRYKDGFERLPPLISFPQDSDEGCHGEAPDPGPKTDRLLGVH
jgi:transcriptional regulator with XRE-family HTH domain